MTFNRKIIYSIAGTFFLLLGIFYFSVDPTETRWVPKCLFFQITGFQCPGCGSQRAIHALLHGNPAEAWEQNAALIILLPLLPFLAWLEFRRERHPILYHRVYYPLNIIFIGIGILVWTIGRNLLQ